MKKLPVLLLLLCTTVLATPLFAGTPKSPEKTEAKMKWFRDAHFGMFIHFGLYSQYAGFWKGQSRKINRCAEWMMLGAQAPRLEYAQMAKKFNPTEFDADAWAKTIHDAGMKYMIITTKHHEGFALFDTDASPYNIVDATPFKRDIIAELVKACRKYRVKIGFYYSQNLDWYHPGGGSGEWDPSHKGDPEKYVNEIAIPQIREILSNYGKIDLLWYDIPNGVVSTENARKIDKMVHELQPDILVNNRLGRGVDYDIQTPENFIPATGIPGADWEVCMTMNHSWGYAKDDHDWKSSREIIHKLIDITSKGGNLLLNVGPMGTGRMPQASLDRLAEVGKWLKTNGEAIHGTRASLFTFLPQWGRFTTRLGKDRSTIYAIVFNVPKNKKLVLPGMDNQIFSARILGTNKNLKAGTNVYGGFVSLDNVNPSDQDFVVAITVKGTAKVSKEIRANAAGVLEFLPRSAVCTGEFRLESLAISGLGSGGEEHLGFWLNPKDQASWSYKIHNPARYQVIFRYALPNDSKGSVIEFDIAGKKLPFTFDQPTGSWTRFATGKVGEVDLPAGINTLTVRTKTLKGDAACNVGTITLRPIAK